MLTTRRRALPHERGTAHAQIWDSKTLQGPYAQTTNLGPSDHSWPAWAKGTQITASESHPGWRTQKGSLSDLGGPFSTTSFEIRSVPTPYSWASAPTPWSDVPGIPPIRGWKKFRVDGHILPLSPLDSALLQPVSGASSNALLTSLGTKAIANVDPTKSIANLSTALIELYREGLPKIIGHTLWKSRTRQLRDLDPEGKKSAGEYLNTEFGWKPLLAEISDLYKSVSEADKILAQYERDSGRVVRRRFEFPSVETATSGVVRSGVAPYIGAMASAIPASYSSLPRTGKVILVQKFTRKQWFSGAFTYHLPADYKSRRAMAGYAAKAEKLFGVSITPEVLWNVAPWSWAADWIFNFGDVIHNVSSWATDGLVLRYGYMMEHVRSESTYIYEGPAYWPEAPLPAPLILVSETKQRVQATPFGFGLTWQGFSPRQLSIIAALGITKSKR